MNNLFGNQLQSPFSPMRNMPMARSGEPVSVNSFESVKTFPTLPNTITILFHEKENLMYRIETDTNNHPAYRFFKYDEIESPIDKTRTATLEDLYKMKEDLINEWQHIWNEPAGVSANKHATDAASAADVKDAGPKPNSTADAANTSKSEPSIW